MTLRPLALVLLLAAAAPAQFIYALNVHGRLSINGTVLDKLPSKYDPQTGQFAIEQWAALAVLGPDRYALRLDGRVQKNGVKLFQLAPATNGQVIFAWRGLAVSENGVHMLRQDGTRALDGVDVVVYPADNFAFTQLAVITSDVLDTVYALRSDGSLFKGTGTTKIAKFTASGAPPEPPDGASLQTSWVDIAVDSTNAQLLVLRADGQLWKLSLVDALDAPPSDGETPSGELEADLPFDSTPDVADLYTHLAVADGEWRVLRADGAVFSPASVVTPLMDYAGDGFTLQDFFGLAWDGKSQYAVRDDGRVYQDDEENASLFKLPGDGYLAVTIGTEAPNLEFFKNPQPKPSPYTVTVLEGDAASVPVLVTDLEKLSDELVVTENPDKPLPLGATFSEVDDGFGHLTRTIEWDGTQPAGTYKCALLVSDDAVEHPKPVKFTETIKVVAADVDTLKNKKPKLCKIKSVQALVDHEIRIPVFASDLDDDVLTFSVNLEKLPFSVGATFDEKTHEIVWTPTFDDIGTVHPKVFVTDGIKTVSKSYTVKVVNSLIFEAPPPPPP